MTVDLRFALPVSATPTHEAESDIEGYVAPSARKKLRNSCSLVVKTDNSRNGQKMDRHDDLA